ncbi:MAG: hypothetical protein DRI48_09925, partial [Chloroflexi bacterium]
MLVLFTALVVMAVGQRTLANRTRPTVKALRVETAPTIDGKLDEDFWSKCDVATNFTEHKTE